MANDNVSVDEYLNTRKDFVTDDGHIRKGVIQTDEKGAAPVTLNAETGEIRFTMSTEQEDRDKDIVIQAGIDLTEFLKNPAAPFAHRSADFPIGKWKDVEPNLKGRPPRHEGTLVPTKGDPNADRLLIHMKAGSVRACSIGFAPKEIKRREVAQPSDGYVHTGYEILSAELYECSPCLIPANPGALAKAAEASGILPAEFLAEILDNWKSIDGLLVPRKAFEEERAKHVVGKTFTFGGRTFKAAENGLATLAKDAPESLEQSSVLRAITDGFKSLTDMLRVPPKSEPKQEAKEEPEQQTDEQKAKALADLDDDLLEAEASFKAIEGRVSRQIAA